MYLDCSAGVCCRHIAFMVLISISVEFNLFGHFRGVIFQFLFRWFSMVTFGFVLVLFVCLFCYYFGLLGFSWGMG